MEDTWDPDLRSLGLYMTDGQGRVRDQDGKLGINSSIIHQADIRILNQNSIARIVEGRGALLITPIWVDSVNHNGSVVNLNDPNAEKADHFRILNLALKNYDEVHRRFPPFIRNGDFPLGKQNTFQATKDQARRIEIVFPDNPPQHLAFCEPMSLATGYPLIQLKGRNQDFDNRLFGDAGAGPTLIPSELSHALHSCLLDGNTRVQAERQYVEFLLSRIASRVGPSHNMGIRTSAAIAYIEAMDHFSSRFSEYLRLRPGDPNPTANFVSAELSVAPPYWLGRLIKLASWLETL
ncbi:hypothetical protein BDV09DRAFT_199694 [Aspergillus tetrazonus]